MSASAGNTSYQNCTWLTGGMESSALICTVDTEHVVSTTPPKPPPLPAPVSIKERRKYSRKYGSGVYTESNRENLTIGSLPDSRSSYSMEMKGGFHDTYSSVPLGFGEASSSAPKETTGYGALNQPSSSSAIERQENAARERAKREERAKQIGKMIHSLDSTQINEVLSMIMTPEQLESLKFYSETASKMRKPVEKKDWNKEFQKLLSRPDDQLKFRKLYNLAHDFVYAASTYAKIIISELLLPESEKTIKPAALGGLAGGTKYVVQNIMFKFVLDFELKPGLWMYGSGDQRSDENAMKSASHELKGLMSYYSCNIRGLCFPLQALVDYKGFRVLAISILPINDETIIYGSSDAGKTVHSKSPDFNEKIDTAARILNLKPHYVNPTVQLSGPGDLEGHLGTDGKFYVLDAARTLPPEGPDENPEFREDRQVYYKLLRPEFVRKWDQPLCSDAFTSWQRYDPNRTENNLEVLKATRYLHEKLIPEFAKRLDKMASAGTTFADEKSKHDAVSESFRLNRESFAKKWAVILDRRQTPSDVSVAPVNQNVLGAANFKSRTLPASATFPLPGGLLPSSSSSPTSGLRKKGNSLSVSLHSSTNQAPLSNTIESKDAETSSKELDIILMNEEMHRIGLNLRHLGEVRAHVKSDPPRQRILIEMVARVIKDLLRAHLRHKMREVKVLSEEPFKEVVIKVFNFVLGRAPQSNSFWALVKTKLQRKYKAALSKREKDEGDPMALCSKMDMAVLFRRLEHLLGITLTESAREELESFPDSFEFVDSDVSEIYPKVKHMQIVDHAEGMALFLTAQKQNVGRRERLRQLRLACEKFARALTTLPDSFTTLYQWGLALIEEAHMTAAFGAVRMYLRASEKFRSAVTINPQFQACFIKLGEAYIELARSAINAQQNGQPLHLPELDDWEDSFREEMATEFKTPPKSATKRYFIKATQAWERGLALPDFFFEEVYQNILRLHSDAVSAREPNKSRSRQLFYGSAILCEVVHNALNDHLLNLMNSSMADAATKTSAGSSQASISFNTSTANSSSASIQAPSNLVRHRSAAGTISNGGTNVTSRQRSNSNPDGMLIPPPSSDSISSIGTAASVPSQIGMMNSIPPRELSALQSTPATTPSSPSTSFVFSSGISVAVPVPAGGGPTQSHTPRIKDVISVITPALKTRLQSVPNQIMSSPYATGIGDEFAAMGTTPTKLAGPAPSHASPSLPHPSQNASTSASPAVGAMGAPTAGSIQSTTSPTPLFSDASSSGSTPASHPSSPMPPQSTFTKGTVSAATAHSPLTQVPVSVGYVHVGVAVVKTAPVSISHHRTPSDKDNSSSPPKTSLISTPSVNSPITPTTAPVTTPTSVTAEKIVIPASAWAPQEVCNPNVRPTSISIAESRLPPMVPSLQVQTSSTDLIPKVAPEGEDALRRENIERVDSPSSCSTLDSSSAVSNQGYEASSDQSMPMLSSPVGPLSPQVSGTRSDPTSRRPSVPVPMLKISSASLAANSDPQLLSNISVTSDFPIKVVTSSPSGHASLAASRSAGNLYHQGIVQNEHLIIDPAEEAVTPRKMRVALDYAPTPFRKVDSSVSLGLTTLERTNSPKPERPIMIDGSGLPVPSPSSQLASMGALNSNFSFLPPQSSSPIPISASNAERPSIGISPASSNSSPSSIPSSLAYPSSHLPTSSMHLHAATQAANSKSASAHASHHIFHHAPQSPATSSLRSFGFGLKHKTDNPSTPHLASPHTAGTGASSNVASPVVQPKPTRTRLRQSASVSSGTTPYHPAVMNPAGLGGPLSPILSSSPLSISTAGVGIGMVSAGSMGRFNSPPPHQFMKPSPTPLTSSANGQYYGGVTQEDEIQQLLNLAQQKSTTSGGTSGVGSTFGNHGGLDTIAESEDNGGNDRGTTIQHSTSLQSLSGLGFGNSKLIEMPTFAVMAEAKFKPFLARTDSPPLPVTRPTDKAEEHTYLKRILLDILAIWSDSLIQYASLKEAGDEMLFLAGAVKLRDVLALDNSYLEIIQTKIIPELKFQARDNRRIHYVLAALHGVIHEHDPTNTQVVYDMGASLHTYAQLHRLNPAKLELHQNEAAECFDEALALDPSFADETIHLALFTQGPALEALLSIVEYSKAMENRARELWDDRVLSVSLAGCASVTDSILVKLVSLCPRLQKLELQKCIKVTDRGLSMISREVGRLTSLNLADCPGISDFGLQHFFLGQQDVGGCKLELLNLKGGLAITDAAVTMIALHCPNLTHLDLDHCRITNNAAATLAQYPLPKLLYISFAFCVKLEDSGLAEIVKTRRFTLKTIKLNGCNMLSDAGIELLVAGMPSLTELHLASLYRISNASVSSALAHLKDLQILDIRNCKGLTWEIFSNLPFDSSLKQLYASRMDPTGRPEDSQSQLARRITKMAGMKSLCANAAPMLQVLDVAESNLPEEPLFELAHSVSHRMVKLDLSGCPLVSDDFMSILAPRMPHIAHLNLNGCYQLTSSGVFIIAQHCRSLRELFLAKVSENRESSLMELINCLPHLSKLDLSGNSHVSDMVLAEIASKLPQLELLNVSATKISDRGVRLICEHLPNLTSFSLASCIAVTNESFLCIAKFCRALKELVVGRCSITDQGIISLAEGVPVLRVLDLDNLSLITDISLLHLVKHQDSLVELSIKFCTKITGDCKSTIMKSYPGLKLKLDPTNTVFSKELAEASKTAYSLRTISSANIDSFIKLNQLSHEAPPVLSAELQSKFDRIKRPKSDTMPTIVQQPASAQPSRKHVPKPYDDPAVVRYTLYQLATKDPITINCNPECLELYLDDEEFKASFGMSKTEFTGLIPWRKKQAKESLRLF